MRSLTASILVVMLTHSAGAQTIDVGALTFRPARGVATIDGGRIKGDPVRLAWSPDMQDLYVQFAERDRRGVVTKVTHLTVRDVLAAAPRIDTGSQEPPWAGAYWSAKSAQTSPVSPSFRIAAESKEEVVRATGTPMGGDLARGGGGASGGGAGAGSGVSVEEVTAATNQTHKIVRWTLRVKNETIGEWVNQAVVPGLTFGWDATRPLIAYSAPGGGFFVMDDAGRRKKIESVAEARLPAWSPDGTHIAALIKDGRRWNVTMIDVP